MKKKTIIVGTTLTRIFLDDIDWSHPKWDIFSVQNLTNKYINTLLKRKKILYQNRTKPNLYFIFRPEIIAPNL